MNAAEAAALIAAVFWALLVSVGVFVLFRLGRLLSESSKLVADVREQTGTLLQQAHKAVDGAQVAVDRASTQLDRTEAVAASMNDLDAGMAELAGQLTALAGLVNPFRGGFFCLLRLGHRALARSPHRTEHRIKFSGGLLEHLRQHGFEQR